MDENKILEQLETSVENIEVPESLNPEQISKKLKQQQKKKKNRRLRRITAMVAGLVVIVAVGGVSVKVFRTEPNSISDEVKTEVSQKAKSAGDAYYLASNYEDVYDAVDYLENKYMNGGVVFEDEEMMVPESQLNSIDGTGSSQMGSMDHSETNKQVEGIDESDIIKNDGKYLYILEEHKIHIVNIETDEMYVEGVVEPSLEPADSILELYVDEDHLYLVVEQRTGNGFMWWDGNSSSTKVETELLTYDITDRSNAKLVGSMKQDGNYYTSRKVDDIIYLFTSRYIGNMEKSDEEKLIPYVNGVQMPADCIYLPDLGYEELIVSSVNKEEPEKTVDQMMILNSGANIYMGLDAIYLYRSIYSGGDEFTEIAKFGYENGYMEAKSSTLVKGTITDTFAISEKGEMLRVLTSNWADDGLINQLYILDEDLKLEGEITRIAPEEKIYAARYIGDMAYFITYRNTDPLFAADLSDPKNPKLLGSLEITGFSDYLHPYGDDKLLGIGYETDPQTGWTMGVKLCMFDITEATNLMTIDTVVFEGEKDTPATYNYKSVLADSKKNLIGFLISDYEDDLFCYKVYQWKDNAFCEVLSKELDNDDVWGLGSDIRGAYAGERFYVITNTSIYSYNYTKEVWEAIDELTF